MKTSKTIKKNVSVRHKKEVARILKANQGICENDQTYIPFMKSFISHLVKEAEGDVAAAAAAAAEQKDPSEFTQDQNQADFTNSLDEETPEDNFDTEGTDPNITANAITAVKGWSEKLEEFAGFMNNPDSQSLHKILAAEDRPGSLLRGVTRKASDSITRIAGEIEKLKEVLNSFIIMAPKKQRDADITKMS
jgi:hypothetical protein